MHNAFGALTSLANLQAIAAMQGAANLSGTRGAAALGGNLDFVGSMNRHAGLGGLGGLGLNSQSHAPFSPLPVALLPFACPSPSALSSVPSPALPFCLYLSRPFCPFACCSTMLLPTAGGVDPRMISQATHTCRDGRLLDSAKCFALQLQLQCRCMQF